MVLNRCRQWIGGLAVAGMLAAPSAVFAQADAEWEYEPGEGYHAEEWYDPSDWFNDDGGVDYETDEWDGRVGDWESDRDDSAYGGGDSGDYQRAYDSGYRSAGESAAGTIYIYDLEPQQGQQQSRQQQAEQQQPGQRSAQDQRARQQMQQQRMQRQQQQAMTNRSVAGEVQATTQAKLRGQDESHLLAQVRTATGETRVVDLGPANQLERRPERGQGIYASGETINTNRGQRVLLANEFRLITEAQQIDREDRQGQVRFQQPVRQKFEGNQDQQMQRQRSSQGSDTYAFPQQSERSGQSDLSQQEREQIRQRVERALTQAGVSQDRARQQAQRFTQELRPSAERQRIDERLRDAMTQAGVEREEAQQQARELAPQIHQRLQGQSDQRGAQSSDQRSEQWSPNARGGRNLTSVRGEVLRTGKVKLQNSDEQRLIGEFRTDEGRTMLVDFGPEQEVRDEISRGDRLTLGGTLEQRSGREVLQAKTFTPEGEQKPETLERDSSTSYQNLEDWNRDSGGSQ